MGLLLATPVLCSGALTLTKVFDTPQNFGGWAKVQVVDVTIGTYATGGIVLTPELLGFDDIYFVNDGSDTARTRLITTKWISSTGMVMCFYNAVTDSVGGTVKHAGTRVAAGTEVANGYTLSTCVVRLMVVGK
jgi:hypothetical protein